jgi:hypothetical protein
MAVADGNAHSAQPALTKQMIHGAGGVPLWILAEVSVY